MTVEFLRTLLGWSVLINWGILLFWFVAFYFLRNSMHKLHGKLFKISRKQLGAIHYLAMALYKLAIILFFLVPYLVLRFLV
ncbi:MAG: hypothetical protein HC895_27090, partial [Leptolyngbyaceae cyanobacterium SM1_3_5]|nr:hypothetical protein [Leptolyngbyaceae cyanobacterium SM1_3_5]